MAIKKTEGKEKTVKTEAAPKKEPQKKVTVAAGKTAPQPAQKKAAAPGKAAAVKAAPVKKAAAVKKKAPRKPATPAGARFECPSCGSECDLVCCGETMVAC